jgi:hypothetical protein
MMRFYYHRSIRDFLAEQAEQILGEMANHHEFPLQEQQRNAWNAQIRILKGALEGIEGDVILEYSIPRIGTRVDCVIVSGGVVFVVEFKVGATLYTGYAIDQVTDYALDLKNFHAESRAYDLVPVLVCTGAEDEAHELVVQEDGVAVTSRTNGASLGRIIRAAVARARPGKVDVEAWLHSVYRPTPTIIEAAQAMYRGHRVEEISRSDAGAVNLTRTAQVIGSIIEQSKRKGEKSICFLTGVPGAGKTLAGLNLAVSRQHVDASEHAVFLSGNGPLVDVLQEALARNAVEGARELGVSIKKSAVLREAKTFIQNIHHFRDNALEDQRAPHERVVVFDEAQRAWTKKQTASFMKTKKGKENFGFSEPEFLVGVMDRHEDWATIVCLIGGGQEINTGEAGLHEWFDSLRRSFAHWHVYVSKNLTDDEYTQGRALFNEEESLSVHFERDLHLAVSLRSFRSERVAAFIKAMLDCDVVAARGLHEELKGRYPIMLTRDLEKAREWVRKKARGSERYGLVASAGALRLKPSGIHVQSEIDPRYWFLNGKEDVRSSFFLEDVATEFDVQGLELDWTIVGWDADLRHDGDAWELKGFTGSRWHDVKDSFARTYLKNAYRVLLTRARQGMVIFVPEGSERDGTRRREFYDGTYGYLRRLGMDVL